MPLQQPEVDDRAAFEAELADLIPEAPEKPLKRIGLRRDQTKEQRAGGERAKHEFARELEQLFPASETTAGEKFSIGATESMADIAKAPELELKFAEFLGVPVETIERHAPILRATAIGARKLADMGRELHQAAREAEPFPAQDFTSQALRGAGSTLPFAVAGPLAGELGVALVGGAQSAVPLYEDVLAETGDEKKAWTGAAIGFGLGLTEAAGVGSILSKLDRASAGTFKKALIRVAAEGSEEALQEWLQTGGQDIATKVLTGKDIRYLQETLPQQGQASAIGALLGGAISGGVEATGHALPGKPQQAPGAEGELTAEDVFAEDVKGQVVGQGGKVRLTGEGGRARGVRTVADVGPETAPKGKAKEPKTEEEAAQAIAEGRPLELEQLQEFPGAIKKAAEIVHAPKEPEPAEAAKKTLATPEEKMAAGLLPAFGYGIGVDARGGSITRNALNPKTLAKHGGPVEGLQPFELQLTDEEAEALRRSADLPGKERRQVEATIIAEATKRLPEAERAVWEFSHTRDGPRDVVNPFTKKAEKLTPGAPQIAPGEAEKPARAEPASTEKASQEPSGDAGAPGVSPISEERAEEHAKRIRSAAFRTPGFQALEEQAMAKGLAREEVRALSKGMDARALAAIKEDDVPALKMRAAEIVSKGEEPITAEEKENARFQLELREKSGAPPPATRLADAVTALRTLLKEHETDEDLPGAIQSAERVLSQRGATGVAATEVDAALEELLRASKLRADIDLDEKGRILGNTKRDKAQTAYTDAAIRHAQKVLDVFDASKGRATPGRRAEDAAKAEEEKPKKGLHSESARKKRADRQRKKGEARSLADDDERTSGRNLPTVREGAEGSRNRKEKDSGVLPELHQEARSRASAREGGVSKEAKAAEKADDIQAQGRSVRGLPGEERHAESVDVPQVRPGAPSETGEAVSARSKKQGEHRGAEVVAGSGEEGSGAARGVRGVRGSEGGGAPRGLREAAGGDVAVPDTSPGTPRGQADIEEPPSAVTEAVTQAKAEIEYADLGIEPEVDEDIDEQTSDGSVVADPGDLPNSMQGGFPADPIAGGGASPRAPIGDRLYGRLEIDPGAPKPGERVSAPQIIEQLSKVVAASGGKTPIRWGRMGTVRSRGFFRVEPEVIRVKTANNIATATHEVGHALEKHVFGWPKGGPWVKPIASHAMQEELVKLGRALYGDKRPAAGYKREGFAEFVRLFVSDPAKAKTQAPQFSTWFEGEFAEANAAVIRELLETRRLVERWGEQGSLERARASMVDPASWGERWKRLKARTTLFAFKRAWTEIGEAYHVFAREAERKMGRLLDPVEDPFTLFQAFRMTHSTRVRRMVSSGMIDLWGNRTGPALDEIRSLVRGRFDDFSIFLWAKRAKALWTDPLKGPRNPGLSEADADQIIADLSTPHFELAAGKVYEWLDGLLSYAAQASPSFRKVVDKIREVDPGSYIPLQRVFDTLDTLWNETRSASARYSGSGIVSALKGSGRNIKNPIQAMLANAERTVLAAHRRLILDATIKLGQVEGMGRMIEEVPIDKRPVDVQLEQILRILGKEHPELLAEGVEGPLALGDFVGEALTFFAPAQFPKGQDPVIPIWDGNKVRWYWVDHRLASALAGLDLPRLPKIADILLGIPNRLFRAGTTGLRASFGLITNPIRDAPTFWMNTRSRSWAPQLFGRYYAEMAKAAGSAVTGGKYEGPYLRAFMDLGGAMATPLGPDSQEVQRAARELVQTGKWRYLDPRNWFEFYKDLVQFPETGTRAAELRGIAEQVGWHPGEPMSPNQALQMLLGAKQVTADFTAAGALARVANQVAPFVTASIAGNRAAVRAARRGQHPLTHFSARYAFRGLQMAAATLALWWLNKDEEWYQELEAKAKFAFWHVAFRWQGQNEVVAIPRPFEIGAVFAALPEMLADAWYRQEPETARKWFAQFFETLNPLSLPAPIEEAAEQLANRDFYWDTPIVPTGELRRSPEEQAGEYTSRVASFLGELFGVSPRRIDHAIRGTMGGVAADVVSVLGLGPPEKEREAELADAPVLGRLFKRGGPLGTSQRSVEDLYVALAAAQAIQASAKRDETPMERNKRLLLEDAAEATAALGYVRTQTRSVDKRRKITEEIVDIARAALEQSRRDVAQRGETKAALRSAKARKENQKKGILSK